MPKKIIVIVLGFFISSSILAQPFTASEKMRWQQEAKQVSITRDKWGVPHVFGKTDADAVFGLMYAQAEDDFGRVEMNYIRMLGRVAEVQGEGSLYEDLQMRMLIDSSAALKDYAASPAWLKKLLQSWADGLNFYLDRHPEIKPLLITRFKPWYPLMWTDGSISAINTAGVSAAEFRNFYNKKGTISLPPVKALKEPTGSNGIAIAPSASASGHAMLYINPHVDFYFRPEVHMASDEGLNVYG
ncbi:MAG: penicillin acylase family protein, partial [Ferruginibacter sp.]